LRITLKSSIHAGFEDYSGTTNKAQGEFILWCDSDDWLEPNAIERLMWAWETIPELSRDNFVSVTALCATNAGVVINPFPNVEYQDTTWNDLSEIHNLHGDMLYFTKAKALKENLFPEVDFVIPESVVWTKIGNKMTRLIPEVLQNKEYFTKNAISFNGKMEYNRGRAYALANTTRYLTAYQRTFKTRLWRIINFIRYSLHGEINYSEQLKLWGNNSPKIHWIIIFPLAFLFVIKDRLQGKVNYTHRDFIKASKIAVITFKRFEI